MRGNNRRSASRMRHKAETNAAAALGYTKWEMRALRSRRRRIMRRGKQMGGDVNDLARIARESKVKVTKLPPGTHIGWAPTWM
jgi:hypothetical protein